MQKVRAIFILARPLNCLITFISVWAGAAVASDVYFSWRIFAASASAALIAGFGNSANDIFDIKIDRINRPYRPLACGKVSVTEAIFLALGLAISGLFLSFIVSRHAILVALLAVVILLVYTPVFKGLSFWGNVAVAAVASLPFIYGGMSVDKPFGAIILSVFAFLLHFGREIVKDIQDRVADATAGIRTGVAIYGAGVSRAIAALLFSALVLSTIVPFAFGMYGRGYLMTVATGADLILLVSIYHLVRSDDDAIMRRMAGWLKAAMPLGLVAVYIGSRGW
jgi:geranylgeranylglycerol-phosphate geranylgeranyltransferase